MTRCIHNACKIRDKAQRPSAFKSQPSGRLTCSTPELGAQFQPHRETKKEVTTPGKHVLKPPHGSMSCYQLSSTVLSWAKLEKEGFHSFQQATRDRMSVAPNGECSNGSPLFNTTTVRVKPER